MTRKELTHEGAWCVFTALRGPDFHPSHSLKAVVTARLRYWARKNLGLSVVDPEFTLQRSLPLEWRMLAAAQREASAWAAQNPKGYEHWAGHVWDALDMVIPFLDDEEGKEANALRHIVLSPTEDWVKIAEDEKLIPPRVKRSD
jgi:hypothetical protein